MTRMTPLGLNRRFEKHKSIPGASQRREERIDIPRREMEIDCGIKKFKIFVGFGQAINTKKMCKKLLAKQEELYNGNKKNISKGYRPQGY